MKRISTFFILSMLSLCAFCQPPSFIIDSLDAYVQRGLKEWQIPGLAMVIVKDGKIVTMRGYGVKELGKNDPVDENTLFMIASNTKLFTGTALANLQSQKKLFLDDKVSKYFPGFRIFDSQTSQLVTLRDLLSHRIGTKTFQGDFTFWNSSVSRKDVTAKMRLLKPVGIFRQDYGYCNSCFLTAGEVIPIVTGKSWEDYITENFFRPLGMENSYALSAGMESRANIAYPYTNTFGPITKIPFDNIDNLAPAGSIVSSVNDISKWLIMQLDSGRYNGKVIFPWNVIRSTRDMNISTGSRKSSAYPTHFRGYGLGLFMSDYNGRAIYYHTGGADGYVTNTCFIPEEKLGIAIFTNNDNNGFFEALRYQVMDAYLSVPYTDRSAFSLKQQQAGEKDLRHNLDSLNRLVTAGKKSMLPLEAYTGSYSNSIYGKIKIERNENGLLMSFSNHKSLTAKLEYMDKNEFRSTYSHAGYGIFPAKFIAEKGIIKSVEIRVNEFLELDSYIFTKDKIPK